MIPLSHCTRTEFYNLCDNSGALIKEMQSFEQNRWSKAMTWEYILSKIHGTKM